MNPWVLLDRDAVPGGGELRLLRRGDEFVIMLGRDELMNSRRAGSEEALARLGCAPIGSRRGAVVLIGGLGLGFTLRAAQPILAANARIVVAELAPAIVRWARGPLRPIFGESLDDPRVSIHAGDVGDLIKGSQSRLRRDPARRRQRPRRVLAREQRQPLCPARPRRRARRVASGRRARRLVERAGQGVRRTAAPRALQGRGGRRARARDARPASCHLDRHGAAMIRQ